MRSHQRKPKPQKSALMVTERNVGSAMPEKAEKAKKRIEAKKARGRACCVRNIEKDSTRDRAFYTKKEDY